MFRLGQKVEFGRNYGPKSKKGIITKSSSDGSWYNIRDDKGRDHILIPFNQIESRESGWHKS